MDEAAIQAKVAKNIPQEPVQEAPTATEETPKESAFDSNVELNIANEGMEFFDYFAVSRIDRWSEESQRQLREVYRWASNRVQSNDANDVLGQILMLENELGTTHKPNRLHRLARWVELEKQTSMLRAQQEMIRHG